MKRLLSILLVLLLFSMPAIAEVQDYSSMSLDELVEMQNAIRQEIASRVLTSLELIYIGEYVVGKDIKAGQYLFTATDTPIENMKMLVAVHVYEDEEKGKRLVQTFLDDGAQMLLTLEEGQVLVIENGSGTIVANPKPSWAP